MSGGSKSTQLCSPELPSASCQPGLALVQLAALRPSLPPPCLPPAPPCAELSSEEPSSQSTRASVRAPPLCLGRGSPPRRHWGEPQWLPSPPPPLVGWRPHPGTDISLVVHVTALQSAQFYKCAGEMKGAGNSDCRASSEKLLTSSSHGQRGRGRKSEREVQEGGEEMQGVGERRDKKI